MTTEQSDSERTMTNDMYDAIHLVASSSGTEGWINLYAVTNALLARCERLRMKVIDTYADIYASMGFEEAEGLHPGDLADDLVTRVNKDDAS